MKPAKDNGGEWRPIPYGNGNYLVSADGDVFSLPRPRATGGLLKPTPYVGGYLRVSLVEDGKKRLFFVHHLVAEAFIGKRPEGYCIAHLNGDPTDNRAENLSFKTQAENEGDKVIHGTRLRGERTPNRKLTWDQVCEIRDARVTAKELANKFRIAQSTVYHIQAGHTWKAKE